MRVKIAWLLVSVCNFGMNGTAVSKTMDEPLVRIAELEIDSAQLDAYRTALKEEIATSIRVEPGVLTLYAVSIKDHPDQIRLFEQYASQSAYEAHLQSPHFKKYKSETQGMVRSLKLIETSPILLGTKAGQH
ncbi:MAG: putative quinol monooxygenase [Bryobacteraceae bacterium]